MLERSGIYPRPVPFRLPRRRRALGGRRLLVVGAILIVATGCYGGEGYGEYGGGPGSPGGDGSVANYGPGAFSQAAANLSPDEIVRFRIGDRFFTQPWSAAPGASPESDGLGPTYLATSCAACHPADGRSSSPASDRSDSFPILRFTDGSDSGTILEHYAVQLQTDAIEGVDVEGALSIEWESVAGSYPDGTPYELRTPKVTTTGSFPWVEGHGASGVRMGPALIGLGLLEAIPEDDIVAAADPDDTDGDGISGVAARVRALDGAEALGRFGLKANVASVADQTAIAYLLDIGITSDLLPDENCPAIQMSCSEAPSGGAPEISASRFADVVFYAQTLAVPSRPFAFDETVREGELVFEDVGCTACHTRRFTTGDHEVEALAGQVIYPYTDLLLHDMGPGLSDGRSDGTASPQEWRTPALWGLGLTRAVNPHAGFLHDGRARTIEEAVLWHDGEARSARDAWMQLPAEQRDRLLIFLKSL